jgi:hypothetical protein
MMAVVSPHDTDSSGHPHVRVVDVVLGVVRTKQLLVLSHAEWNDLVDDLNDGENSETCMSP